MTTQTPPVSAEIIELVERARLGQVATITPEGHPHVSPKGTVWLPDDARVGFAHIHSHRTVAHLEQQPRLTTSVVDVFQRRGVIVWGTAQVVQPDSRGFQEAAALYRERRGSVPEGVRAFVVADITEWEATYSPAYDNGTASTVIEARWREFYQRQYHPA